MVSLMVIKWCPLDNVLVALGTLFLTSTTSVLAQCDTNNSFLLFLAKIRFKKFNSLISFE